MVEKFSNRSLTPFLWWHSDLKVVAYPYVHKLYYKFVELGGLKSP